MSELKGRVIASLRWQLAAKLGSQLISWSVTIFVMRLLSPAEYGLMAMTMVLVGLTALVAEMGLGAALVRSEDVDLDRQRRVFGLSLIVNTGLYALLMLVAPLSVLYFSEPRLLLLTLVMGLQLPLAALVVVPESMARRELRFKALGLIELCVQTGAALTTLGCALAGLGVWSLVAGQLAHTLIKSVLLVGRFGIVMPRFGLRGQRELLVFGGSLTANRIVWFMYSQADVFVAGRLLGAQLLGAYSVAVNLANLPMQKMMAISNQVAFAAFSEINRDAGTLTLAVQRSVRLVATIAIGLLWGLAAAAPVLVPLLLGDKWQVAIVPLQLIAAAVPLRVVSSTLSTAMIAAGHVGIDLRNNLTGLALLVPAFIAGAHLGGVNGLALAWLVAFPLFFLIVARRSAHALGLSMMLVLRQLARPVLSGVLMVGAMAACATTLGHWPSAAVLALEIASGAAAFIAGLALLDRATLSELLGFMRPGRASRPPAAG